MTDDKRAADAEQALVSALTALGAAADAPLLDGVLAPGTLARALDAFARGERDAVLLVVHPKLGSATEGYAPEPKDSVFLRLFRRGEAIEARLVGLRGDGVADVSPGRVEIIRTRARCCDAPACEVEREVVGAWVELGERGSMLFAEGRPLAGQPDDGASDAARAFAKALGIDLEGEAGASHLDPAVEDAELSAREVGRYGGRGEGDHLVLRDLFSVGPRASAGRNFVIAAIVAVLAAAVWASTGLLAREGATARAVAVGAVAALLTLTAYAFFGVARFSSRYVARSAPLAAFGRGRFVVLPWVGRGGAIDLRPEGRLGAAIPSNEVTAVTIAKRGEMHAVAIESDHGPIDVVAVADERLARYLRAIVARAVELSKHPDAKLSARQRARAKAQERPAKAS